MYDLFDSPGINFVAHLYTYPENLGSGGLLPAELRAEFVCFFCSFVRHATMLGTESLDVAYTH